SIHQSDGHAKLPSRANEAQREMHEASGRAWIPLTVVYGASGTMPATGYVPPAVTKCWSRHDVCPSMRVRFSPRVNDRGERAKLPGRRGSAPTNLPSSRHGAG